MQLFNDYLRYLAYCKKSKIIRRANYNPIIVLDTKVNNLRLN